ncbi:MAG: hypothetical protein OER56_14615 [Hyphomicrobiales bacterium]|nr:hypothetical protein [Hyphomicrobiales bacterium]
MSSALKLTLSLIMAIFLATGTQLAHAGSAKTFTLKGSHTINGLFSSLSVTPVKVDNKKLQGFFGAGPGKDVPAGRRTILLYVKLRNGAFDWIYNGGATVKANLRAGRTYQAVGKVKGKSVKVWIKDAKSGKRVSSIVAAKMTKCPPVLKACH